MDREFIRNFSIIAHIDRLSQLSPLVLSNIDKPASARLSQTPPAERVA